jgi:hypothetical protein
VTATAIEEVQRLAFSSLNGGLLAGYMYTVYGDESSDAKRERVFAVAGVIGSESEWKGLEYVWKARTGGKIFHAAECEVDKKDGEYQNNQNLYRDLTKILASSALVGFGAAISLAQFKAMFPRVINQQPYYICFSFVASYFVRLSARMIPQGRVEFTFDNNIEIEHSAGLLYQYMMQSKSWREWDDREYLADKISFATRKTVGIQVADLVARETMKWSDGIGRSDIRKSMKALIDTKRFTFEFYGTDWFNELIKDVEAMNIPGNSLAEYDAWRSNLNLDDNCGNRIRYLSGLKIRSQKSAIS